MSTIIGGYQVAPRERDSFHNRRIKTRKPYCLDCGGLPMLSTYVRKQAQGKQYFVIGYWCQFCDRWISESDWHPHQEGKFEGAASWSFSEKRSYVWMDYIEYLEKMMELHSKKLQQLEKQITDKRPEIVPLYENHVKILQRRIRGLQRRIRTRKKNQQKKKQ